MAEIKVERKDHDDYDRRPKRKFPMWLLAIPVLGLLALPALFNNDDDRNANVQTEQRQAAAPVEYQGRTWVPQGEPVAMSDDRLTTIGRSSQGVALFSDAAQGGGGGQGTMGLNRIFVRTNDGLYQPMVMR